MPESITFKKKYQRAGNLGFSSHPLPMGSHTQKFLHYVFMCSVKNEIAVFVKDAMLGHRKPPMGCWFLTYYKHLLLRPQGVWVAVSWRGGIGQYCCLLWPQTTFSNLPRSSYLTFRNRRGQVIPRAPWAFLLRFQRFQLQRNHNSISALYTALLLTQPSTSRSQELFPKIPLHIIIGCQEIQYQRIRIKRIWSLIPPLTTEVSFCVICVLRTFKDSMRK